MVYPFCFLPFLGLFLWNWPSHFPQYWVCVDLVTMSCCFQAPRQWCWCFRSPVLRFLVIFFHPTDRPTQSQETYSTLNERKGDDLSLMVSFWASPPHCFCVFLYTCLLLCFVLFCRWSKLKLYKDPQYSLWRLSKAHKKNEKRDDLLTARAIGWG